MAKVSPLKVATGGRHLGNFKVEAYNMFEDDDLAKYAAFRNYANDNKNGVKIELMREYSRKTTTTETMEGGSSVTTNTEEIILVVHYWENPPTRTRGQSDEEPEEREAELRTVSRRGVPVSLER
jgi:hypothetical protein